jgi:hypothetical protein
MEAGFDHHLVKPVDGAELLRLLGRSGSATEGSAATRTPPAGGALANGTHA